MELTGVEHQVEVEFPFQKFYPAIAKCLAGCRSKTTCADL